MMFRKLRITGLNNKAIRFLSALLIVAVLSALPFSASAEEQPIAQEKATFTDLAQGNWYYEIVMNAVDAGLFQGLGNGIFDPEGKVTRAQFATALARLCKVDVQGMEGAPFADVPKDQWYYSAVSWAYNAGIVNGISETQFAPDADITRQQMCKMMAIAVEQVMKKELPTTNAKTFADGQEIADWAVEYVQKCSANGIIQGRDGNVFDPNGNATRAESAAVFYRTYARFSGEVVHYSVSVEGFALEFDANKDYYLIQPADFKNCKITGYGGFTDLKVSVEQYAGHYPYLAKAYKMGDALELGYGRAKVTLTATLADGSVKNYMLTFTDPNALSNSYAKVFVNSSVNLRESPSVSANILACLDGGITVYYLGTEGEWAKVQYVKSTKTNGVLTKTTSYVGYIKDTAEENYIRWNWETVEMPETYQASIDALKAAHPNWSFTFVDPEMTLQDAITKYGESRAAYIDPLYYLNEDKIFAFMDIDTYDPATWTDDGIKAIWANEKAITKDQALSYFKNASNSLLMNPYYIACRAALESGYGSSQFAKGIVAGYEGYYNFFGIQCYDSNPTIGAKYAKERNWNTVEISITEGANWIKDQYLDRGAVTPYFFRYAGFWNKSYMSDGQAPEKEAQILKRAFSDPNAKAHFIIPVYRAVPQQ